MKKILFLVSIIISFSGILFAEDWEPTINDGKKLEKVNGTVKNYIEKNGTYLSGTKNFSLNSVIINYNGTDFLMYTTEYAPLSYNKDNPGEFTKRITIPYRFSYLQGKRVLTIDQLNNCTYAYSNESYRFWLLGIDRANDLSQVYFQTYITDDNYVGWIWSNYLKNFSFDSTNRYDLKPSF